MLAVLVIEVLNVFIAGEHWIAVDLCREIGFIVQVLCFLSFILWKRRCGILWIVHLTLLVLVRDYVYPCSVVLGGLLLLVGALLWLPMAIPSATQRGCTQRCCEGKKNGGASLNRNPTPARKKET